MVLIHHFHSTSLWKAFILNSMVTSLVILIAITLKSNLDNYISVDDTTNIHRITNWYSITITLLVTFCTTLIAYLIMYLLFGFGGGMLSES